MNRRHMQQKNIVVRVNRPLRMTVPPEYLPRTDPQPFSRLVHVPYENSTNDRFAFLSQANYFRILSKMICRVCEISTITYDANPDEQWIKVELSEYWMRFGTDASTGITHFESNYLKNRIALPGMNYKLAGSLFIDYVFRSWEFKIAVLNVKSDFIQEGFPTGKLQCDCIRFESTDPRTEAALKYWMPFVVRVRLMHVGNVFNEEQRDRAIRMHNEHFHGKISGWQGDSVPVDLINVFRRVLPMASLHRSIIPVGHVFRWIKGWMMGLTGYSHLDTFYYHNPRVRLHRGVFGLFLKVNENFDEAGHLFVHNFEGKRAQVWLTKRGALAFKVVESSGQPMPVTEFPFNIDDVVDSDDNVERYKEIDEHSAAHIELYGIVRP